MSDIRTLWDNINGRGDYQLAGADLATGADLMTAVLLSLFTDRQAEPSDLIPDGSGNRRGWWDDPTMGSRLWLLDRSKLTPAVAQQAQGYIAEGLQWMIDDGVTAGFKIACQVILPSSLYATIQAFRTLNGVTAKNFGWTWQGNVLYPASAPSGANRPWLSTEGGGFILTTEDGTIITA